MSQPVELTLNQWQKIRQHIAEHYPPSALLIRDCMRRDLGFTTREHIKDYPWFAPAGIRRPTIMLDFYDEAQRTFFLLKYSNILNQDTE
jgi:hypothetical protein